MSDPALTQPWRVRPSVVTQDILLERPDRRDPSGYSPFTVRSANERAILDLLCSGINERMACQERLEKARAVIALIRGALRRYTDDGLMAGDALLEIDHLLQAHDQGVAP